MGLRLNKKRQGIFHFGNHRMVPFYVVKITSTIDACVVAQPGLPMILGIEEDYNLDDPI